jgi:outer membrane protein
MRSMFRATVIALVLSSIAGVAQAQVKIAFVNSQALMEAAPGRPAAESLLTKEGEGYRAQLTKLQDSVNALLTKYQKDEPTLTAATKDSRQKAIQALETDLQAKQLQFQQAFAQRQSEVMAPITDVVKKVLDDIRNENGYAMILDNAPGASNIVSADKNLDITDKVVSRLRATAAPVRATTTTTPQKPGAASSPAGVTRPKPPAE